jgi:hypothetical protein
MAIRLVLEDGLVGSRSAISGNRNGLGSRLCVIPCPVTDIRSPVRAESAACAANSHKIIGLFDGHGTTPMRHPRVEFVGLSMY